MDNIVTKPQKTRGCLKTFFIIIGALTASFFILAIIAFAFNIEDDNSASINTMYNIESDSIFSEKLILKDDYDNVDSKLKYDILLKNLSGTYSVRTQEYDFSFRKGMTELHVIPVFKNKTNSDKRIVLSVVFGGPISGHLAFGLKSKNDKKGLIDFQFDSKTNPEKIVVVKYSMGDTKYCKRGVVYSILEQKGNLF
ncbi:hypothetical protein CEY12_00805 [Chryseobacterium sp. T16E-39]|uniref:hypothetical protein n=1 Tax=Chryseobacterium sp. T16E-39 TaxID=2015076 RepID=UPI000B5B280E|nr:hypothetical protein [Chryseobacterium sp. T16E-39]ASK28739.1 hypothetical protein CEY12_00805 [Chryseobacterium sp. T16E-39]